jgi:hypothetical protein
MFHPNQFSYSIEIEIFDVQIQKFFYSGRMDRRMQAKYPPAKSDRPTAISHEKFMK